jgi:hypothetical protein
MSSILKMRFETDSYFPEPMWGQKQRAAQLDLPSFEVFRYFCSMAC